MDRKVSTACLKSGMYVSKLDRPWVQTPFLIQGFFIKDEDEISLLVKYCDYVFIDIELGVGADVYFDTPGVKEAKPQHRLSTNRQVEAILDMEQKLFGYADKSTTVEELPEAKLALEKATECVAEIVEHDLHNGKLDIKKVNNAVEPILESMIRNSDAFMWLAKMRKYDAYSYEHSLQNCALGIALGRHMGLNKRALNTLAVGLLLMDVGKIRLPKEILTKSDPLTPAETEIMRKHVAYSVEILRNTPGMNEHVINIALTHHERYDGSGYPNGLIGIQTPAYGRIAAVIDCYDAMITTTPYRKGVSEHKALQSIYNLRNKHFQTELVEQFMQCMGVYPTGSLVELSSGAVGAVLSQNTQQKLRPKIILLLDEDKRPYKKRQVFDLASQSGIPVHISKSLENYTYGIDVKQLGI